MGEGKGRELGKFSAGGLDVGKLYKGVRTTKTLGSFDNTTLRQLGFHFLRTHITIMDEKISC